MSLFPMLMASEHEVHQVATMNSNAGFGHISYDGLVFFLALARDGDNAFLEYIESQIDEIGPVKRIWPPSGEQHFPGAQAPPHVISDLLALSDAHQRVHALPTVGLTLTEMKEAQRAQSLGATPLQIRAIWQPESLAQFERKRLEDDPDGYGRTWEPYKTLGGIEWHGGRFDEAIELYEQARTNGATTQDIGSQMCDALLYAGRYEDAQAVADEVGHQGPNEWRDVFRSAILFELVDELGLRLQKRQLRTAGGIIKVDEASIRAAYDYLRTTDALDMPSWAAIAQDDPAGARISRIMASAYLGEAEDAWFLLSAATYHWPNDEPLKQPVLEALAAQPPKTHAFIHDILAEDGAPEATQLLAYLDANVLTTG
ncbi:tetratricopeptide repeat protein [Aeromicrobium sp. WCS2018Hpa-33]|nr:tetratricopeptide repeat protein [Aeromicrobium sp. WCS2018Hpa-33]